MKGVSHVSIWGKRIPDRTSSAKSLRWECAWDAREITGDSSVAGTQGGRERRQEW